MPISVKMNKNGIKNLKKQLEYELKKQTIMEGDVRLRKDSEKFLEVLIRKREESGEDSIICPLDIFNEIPNIRFNIENIMDDLKIHGCISDNSSVYISGDIKIMLTMEGIEYFRNKEERMGKEQRITNNTNNFYAETTGVQIQQGTVSSTQSQSVDQKFNYNDVDNIIQKIKKYDDFLDDEYGEKAADVRDKINEIELLLQKKEQPSKIRVLLNDIKNLSIGVAGSIVASGIVALIGMV